MQHSMSYALYEQLAASKNHSVNLRTTMVRKTRQSSIREACKQTFRMRKIWYRGLGNPGAELFEQLLSNTMAPHIQ